jgi:hypothetical protein
MCCMSWAWLQNQVSLWMTPTCLDQWQKIRSRTDGGIVTEQKYKQHLKCSSHVSWAEIKHPRNCLYEQNIFSNVVHTFVDIPVSQHLYFVKIIHPPDSCGISRRWLNSMILIQVHLVLGTIKGHSKMCSFVTMAQMSYVLRERAIGMLTASMYRVVAR